MRNKTQKLMKAVEQLQSSNEIDIRSLRKHMKYWIDSKGFVRKRREWLGVFNLICPLALGEPHVREAFLPGSSSSEIEWVIRLMLPVIIAWLLAFTGLKMLVTYNLSAWRNRGRPISIAFFFGLCFLLLISVTITENWLLNIGGLFLILGLIWGLPFGVYSFCKIVERGFLSTNKEVAMLTYLKNDDKDIRRAAALTLVLRGPHTHDAIIALRKLADSDKDMCTRAIAALRTPDVSPTANG